MTRTEHVPGSEPVPPVMKMSRELEIGDSLEIGAWFLGLFPVCYFLRRTFFFVEDFFGRADFFRTTFAFWTFFLTAALGLTRLAVRGAGLRLVFLARLA